VPNVTSTAILSTTTSPGTDDGPKPPQGADSPTVSSPAAGIVTTVEPTRDGDTNVDTPEPASSHPACPFVSQLPSDLAHPTAYSIDMDLPQGNASTFSASAQISLAVLANTSCLYFHLARSLSVASLRLSTDNTTGCLCGEPEDGCPTTDCAAVLAHVSPVPSPTDVASSDLAVLTLPIKVQAGAALRLSFQYTGSVPPAQAGPRGGSVLQVQGGAGLAPCWDGPNFIANWTLTVSGHHAVVISNAAVSSTSSSPSGQQPPHTCPSESTHCFCPPPQGYASLTVACVDTHITVSVGRFQCLKLDRPGVFCNLVGRVTTAFEATPPITASQISLFAGDLHRCGHAVAGGTKVTAWSPGTMHDADSDGDGTAVGKPTLPSSLSAMFLSASNRIAFVLPFITLLLRMPLLLIYLKAIHRLLCSGGLDGGNCPSLD
jgi:hypothetical protein